jgi:glycosyltransferase involved in cell wall biosynthesis
VSGVQDDHPDVVFCTPTLDKPHPAYVAAMEATIPRLDAHGITHRLVFEVGCPYISAARATMLRKALDAKADLIVFIDHDLSWNPEDLVTLVRTRGEVVAGLYRFKKDDEEYMGAWETGADNAPALRPDGNIRATRVSAGFLKVSKEAVERFMRAYPELSYGSPVAPSTDLFNHGAHEGVWWGEDYAFSRRWLACGGEIAVIPDLNLTHHAPDKAYPGNLHRFLMRQPGGALDPERIAP